MGNLYPFHIFMLYFSNNFCRCEMNMRNAYSKFRIGKKKFLHSLKPPTANPLKLSLSHKPEQNLLSSRERTQRKTRLLLQAPALKPQKPCENPGLFSEPFTNQKSVHGSQKAWHTVIKKFFQPIILKTKSLFCSDPQGHIICYSSNLSSNNNDSCHFREIWVLYQLGPILRRLLIVSGFACTLNKVSCILAEKLIYFKKLK